MTKKVETRLTVKDQNKLAVIKHSDSRSSDADTIRSLIDKAYKRIPKAKRKEIEEELGLE